jgi:tellurite resistance protein
VSRALTAARATPAADSPYRGEAIATSLRVGVKTNLLAVLLAAAAFGACASEQSSSERRDRASSAVEACGDHEGVAAIEDSTVICGDDSSNDERGERAVAACREHDGVAAFDDDIVICRDQTFHEVVE